MSTDNIKAVVKVRPGIPREIKEKLKPQWYILENNIINIDDPSQGYSFDHVFTETHNNSKVYETCVKPLVMSSLRGVNSTIFAYGQTSSGKTHTMYGNASEAGVMVLALDDIFRHIEEDNERDYLVRCSYLEIYNEKINDLLNKDKETGQDIKIRETIEGVPRADVKEEVINERSQAMTLVQKGSKIRKIGCTDMNERSSRSHTIFKIVIHSQPKKSEDLDPATEAQINLVDLAGSERVGQTRAVGSAKKEGVHINMSLHNLGIVMRKLSDGSPFIGFRDSKLTRLLQNALGGNTKTLVIATITLVAAEETKSTLEFAQIARTVKIKPVVNVKVSTSADKEELNKIAAKYLEKMKSITEDKIKLERVIEEYKDKVKHLHIFVKDQATECDTIKKLQRRHTIHAGTTQTLFLRPKKYSEVAEDKEEQENDDTRPSGVFLSPIQEEAFILPQQSGDMEDLSDYEDYIEKINQGTQTDYTDIISGLPTVEEESLESLSNTPEPPEPELMEHTRTPVVRRQLEDLEKSYKSLRSYTKLEKDMGPSELEMFRELKEKLEQLQQDCISVNSLYTDSSKKVILLTQELKSCQDQMTKLKNQNQEGEETKECLMLKIEQMKVDNAYELEHKEKIYKDKISLLEKEVERLRLENDTYNKNIEIESIIREKDNRIKSLEQFITELDNYNFDNIQKLENEKEINEQLLAQLESYKSEHETILSERVAAENEVAQILEQTVESIPFVSYLKKYERKLQQKCQNLLENKRNLKRKLIRANKRKTKLEKKNNHLKRRINSLKKLKYDHAHVINETEQAMSQFLDAERNTLEKNVMGLERQLYEMVRTNAITKREQEKIIKEKIEEAMLYKTRNIQLNVQIEELTAAIEMYGEGYLDYSDLRAENSTTKTIIRSLEKQLKTCTDNIEHFQMLLKKKGRLEECKLLQSNRNLEIRIIKEVQENKELHISLQRQYRTQSILYAHSNEKIRSITILQRKVSEHVEDNCNLQNKLAELETKLKSLEDYENKLLNADSQITAFEEQLMSKSAVIVNLVRLIGMGCKLLARKFKIGPKEVKQTVIQRTTECEALNETLLHKINELKSCKKENEKLKNQNNALLKKLYTCEGEYDKLIQRICDLEDIGKNQAEMILFQQNSEESLQKEILKLHGGTARRKEIKQVEELNETIRTMTQEIKQLKQSLEETSRKYQLLLKEKKLTENVCNMQKADMKKLKEHVYKTEESNQQESTESKHSLLCKVKSLESDNLLLKKSVEMLELNCQRVTQNEIEYSEKLQKLQKENDELQKLTKQLSDLEEYESKLKQLKKHNSELAKDLEARISIQEREIKKLQEASSQLQRKNTELQESKKEAGVMIEKLNANLDLSADEIESLIKKNSELQLKLDMNQTRHISEMQKCKEEYEKLLKEKQILVQSKKSADTTAQRRSSSNSRESKTESPREAQKRKRHSTHDLNRPSLEIVKETEKFNAMLEEIKADSDRFKAEYIKLDREAQELCQIINARDKEILKLKEENNALQEEKNALSKRPPSTNTETMKTTRIYELEKIAVRYRRERDSLRQEVQAQRNYRSLLIQTKNQETQVEVITKDVMIQVTVGDDLSFYYKKYLQYRGLSVHRRKENLHLRALLGIDPNEPIILP